MKRHPTFAFAALRLSLLLFPRRHRRRFGSEIRRFVLDDYRSQVESGETSPATFWWRTFRGIAANGLATRFEAFRPRGGLGADGHGRAGIPGSGGPDKPGERGVGSHGADAGRRRTPELFRDAPLTLRALLRSPGYSLTSLATLALGIGACTVIFSVTRPILLAPLPYPDADRLMVVRERSPGPDGIGGWVSPLTFRDWRESTETFEDLVAWRLSVMTWTGGDSPELIRGWAVSAGFFPIMGVDMTLGRGLNPEEDQPGGNPVVVLSHGFWGRAFGSDRDILGESMTLDGTSYTIIGVAGPELDYPSDGDYWVPIALDYAREFRDFRYLGVVGRIRPDRTETEAAADLDRLALAVAAANPDTNDGWGAEIHTLKEVEVGRIRPVLLGMGAAVAILLLIAVGNVTNLTLSRAAGRRTDTAIRKALGAGSGTLVQLLLGEAFLLSLAGAALGLFLAALGLGTLESTSLLDLPRIQLIGLGPVDLLFGLGVAVLVGATLGAVSVLASRGFSLSEALRAGGAGGMATARSQRTREVVLASQVALALTLLIGASVLSRSLMTLSRVDVGFEPAGLLTFSYDLPSATYPDADSYRGFETAALERIQSIPGVEASGFVTPIPLEMGSVPSSWSLPADVRAPADGPVMAHMRSASPGYFPAMGIELVAGRLLDAGDRFDSEQVVLVNRTFVDRYLPDRNPVGTRITAGEVDDETAEWATVVGIVNDVRFLSLRVGGEPEIYLPISQLPAGWGHLTIRSRLQPEALARSVQEAIQTIDPNLPLSNIRTGEQMIGTQLRTSRLSTLLTSLFAFAASALAFVGILGVLSILVAQRMREIGLRMVLGAGGGSVWRFILFRGMRPVVIGLVLGAALAGFGTRVLESQLFGVSTLDPLAFLLPPIGLAAVGILACLVPGARASATDPVMLLKSE